MLLIISQNVEPDTLQSAYERDDEIAVTHFLQHPLLDVTVTDCWNNTPLHMACYWGLTDIVKKLLQNKKLNINKQNYFKCNMQQCVSIKHNSFFCFHNAKWTA